MSSPYDCGSTDLMLMRCFPNRTRLYLRKHITNKYVIIAVYFKISQLLARDEARVGLFKNASSSSSLVVKTTKSVWSPDAVNGSGKMISVSFRGLSSCDDGLGVDSMATT